MTSAPLIALLIPAHRPGASLAGLIQDVQQQSLFSVIVVVDDGSGPAFGGIFAELGKRAGLQVLRHAVNLGKGAALKTGLNYLLTHYPDLAGVVTADADGQHHPEDIARVAATLAVRPRALTMGVRGFGPATPLRSRIGNSATRLFFSCPGRAAALGHPDRTARRTQRPDPRAPAAALAAL